MRDPEPADSQLTVDERVTRQLHYRRSQLYIPGGVNKNETIMGRMITSTDLSLYYLD